MIGANPTGVGDFVGVWGEGGGRALEVEGEDEVEVLFVGGLGVADCDKGGGFDGEAGFFENFAGDGEVGWLVFFDVTAREGPAAFSGVVGALNKEGTAVVEDETPDTDGEAAEDNVAAAAAGDADAAAFWAWGEGITAVGTEAFFVVGGLFRERWHEGEL